ncbi:hypothetical protein JYU14_02505 [Simkania negevensis]|uniref:UVR domain-containing protein n=1 Tax=Simkania negevensis TaxID=83561 RepID=A0ABS3AQZ5_9BACT|nr:hypothetical protein [Simkania negevensis]
MSERPIECTECKKPIAYLYTEIVAAATSSLNMCAECPRLQERLHGKLLTSRETAPSKDKTTGVCCGNCGTTLEAVKMGSPLGCSECYEIFSELLLIDLIRAKKVPRRLTMTKKSSTLHTGRTPGAISTVKPSARLLALHEALSDTLSREDYEQAAWIRDQIKEIMEKADGEKEKKQG